MDRETLKSALVELLDEILPEPLPELWPEDRPLAHAALDSAAVLELVRAVEERFAIRLDDSDLTADNFGTLGGLVSMLERLTGAAR